MSVCVNSIFVLPYICSGLATGRSLVQGVLPTVYKIHNFIINSEYGQSRERNPSRQKKKKKSELFLC
jgi:hypothetical protein